MNTKNTFQKLVKQCIAEVLIENVNYQIPCPKCGKQNTSIDNPSHPIIYRCNVCQYRWNPDYVKESKIRNLVKECVMEVLKEDLAEGFDPLSQAGPNTCGEENPYPAWNAKMRTMEEEHEHGRYAQEAGAGQFDAKTFRQLQDEHDPGGKNHDLKLRCIKCNTTQTCKCSAPKRTFDGICDQCAKGK